MGIEKGGILFVFVMILLMSVASAGIVISPTKAVYNAGDEFDVTISVKPTKTTRDFLTAGFVCAGRAIEIYKAPLTLDAGVKKDVQILTSLDSFIIGEIGGDCFVRADYGEESVTGKNFQISWNVDVGFELNEDTYDPGKDVSVIGQAVKSNGEALEGFVDISVTELGYSSTSDVTAGRFNLSFSIPDNAAAGSYNLIVSAYELEGEETTNKGQSNGIIKVRQIMKKVDVALESQEVMPENEISYSVVAYDQSGGFIPADATVIIRDPNGNDVKKSLAKTSEGEKFYVFGNSTPGSWKIYAKVEGLETQKEFSVLEYEKISFTLEDKMLSVNNIGNVPFSGPVEISIGGVSEVKEIENLEVGESKKYKLVAPDGQYEILVNDGGEKQNLGKTLLTGRAISVDDIGGVFGNSAIILMIVPLILAVLVVVIYLYRRKKKREFIGKTSGSFTQKGTEMPVKKPNISYDSATIDKGTKQESIIVALGIKNMAELRDSDSGGLNAVDSALWKAKESGAKIYSEGDYRLIVLAPVLTKDKDFMLKGVRIAEDLSRILNEYNKRTGMKIKFGIGVNVGNLAVESSEEGKFKFISLDNTISAAKRIAQEANSKVIISEKARSVNVGKIKVKKAEGKDNLFELEKVTDRSAYQDYIQNFKRSLK